MLHTTHKVTETKIVFESIACVYNRLKFDVHLTAFLPGKKKGTYITKPGVGLLHESIVVPSQEVGIIPITWFEKGYEVRVAHFDANTSER